MDNKYILLAKKLIVIH